MRHSSFTLSALLLVGLALPAQTYNTAPSGFANVEGRDNNTIPWWTLSATYQQVHDAVDLLAVFGPIAVINSINLRKDAVNSTAPGRTLDMQITLGVTPITAETADASFAVNLGPTPQVVLPYTPVNLPTLSQISTPNPIGWSFPFATPFTYAPTPGNNLCWEFRFTNSTTNAFAALDAVGRLNAEVQPNVGSGCLATGQSLPAAISQRSLSMQTGAWRNLLDRAAVITPAVQLVGVGQATIQLPGFCSNLEFLPLVTIAGGTDGAGQWDSTLTFGPLGALPTIDLMAQFAFIDGNLPNSIGLSDATLIRLPPNSIRNLTRIWAAPFQGGLGNETAVAGSRDFRYGLVTIFGQ